MNVRPWVLAIDFGTSYMVAVARIENREPEVIEIAGERRVPSVVLAESEQSVLVGRVADQMAASHPGDTMRAPKSRLGDQAPVVLGGRPHDIVGLVAEMLRYVYDNAVAQLGGPPDEVKLTHPAAWNRPWLTKLLAAAERAGIPNASLVPEPVAAALYYASEVGVADGDTIAVYDLGGGTFDAAVVAASGEGFAVIGRPGGDNGIGGELLDELLTNFIGEQLPPEAWDAMRVGADSTWQQVAAGLRKEATRCKEMLSSHGFADAIVALPAGMQQVRIAKEDYEDLIRPYVEETVDVLDRCIANAGLRPDQLKAIALVGGASRTPLVEQLVGEAFPGVVVSRRGDPKSSTALGAVRARQTTETTVGLAGWATHPGTDPTPSVPSVAAAPPAPDAGGTVIAGAAPPVAAAPPSSVPPTAAPPPSVPSAAAPPPMPPASVPPAAPPPTAMPPAAPPPPPITPPPVVPSAATPPPAFPSASQPPPSGSKRSPLVLVGIVLVVVIAAAVGAVAVLGGDDDQRTLPVGTTSRSVTTTVRSTSTLPPSSDASYGASRTDLRTVLLTAADVRGYLGSGVNEVRTTTTFSSTLCNKTEPTPASYARREFSTPDGAVLDIEATRYRTEADATAAIGRVKASLTGCTNMMIGGARYFVGVSDLAPDAQAYTQAIVAYLLDSSTAPAAGSAAPAEQIYQYWQVMQEGDTVLSVSYVSYDRIITDAELLDLEDLAWEADRFYVDGP